MKNLLILSISLLLLNACTSGYDGELNFPLLYKIDVQQGNIVDQKMLYTLEPGMDKEQVKFMLGTPMLADPFHDDRWEYIYSYQKGGQVRKQRRITIHFEEGKLSHISRDIKEILETRQTKDNIVTEKTAIVAPEDFYEKNEDSFFGKFWDTITNEDD